MEQSEINDELGRLSRELNIEKISRTSKIISLAVVPLLFILFVYGSLQLNNLYKEIDEIRKQTQKEKIRLESLLVDNKALEDKKSKLERELMVTYGLPIDSIRSLSTDDILEKSLAANQAIKSIIKNFTPDDNVIIRYYKKTIDEKRVALELEALGYNFEEKMAASMMEKKKTNAIWFGSRVSLQDVKLVSLALLRAGIPIKGIRPYKNNLTNPAFKSYIIEVGASVDLENKPVLTVEEVENASQFTRN